MAKGKAISLELAEAFRLRIRQLLDERQVTQTQLADAIGVSQPHLSDILAGKKGLGMGAIEGLLRLDPSLAALLMPEKGPPVTNQDEDAGRDEFIASAAARGFKPHLLALLRSRTGRGQGFAYWASEYRRLDAQDRSLDEGNGTEQMVNPLLAQASPSAPAHIADPDAEPLTVVKPNLAPREAGTVEIEHVDPDDSRLQKKPAAKAVATSTKTRR